MSEAQVAASPDSAISDTVGSSPVSTVADSTTVNPSSPSASVTSIEKHGAAVITRPSSLPKPSGLKPPTKIGRLCSNSAPKPAVPVSPRTDGAARGAGGRRGRAAGASLPPHSSSAHSASERYASVERDDETRHSYRQSRHTHTGAGSNAGKMPVETKISFSDTGSADALRKYSDEYSRKTLSDLLEDEEEGEVTTSLPSEKSRPQRKVSTSSTYSVTSMDALWEKHPRRLSEAGLRRSSDHSVVLTEDTDSFIIGDRVWVGGTKPGQIAYIGETQFAPGEWAGVVLDEPIGKNDGSVAGIRYFQCPEKRGVFSRLTRLTRVPLISPTAHAHDASPASDAGSVFDRPPSGAGRVRRALSPNGSIRSAISSKMNASITPSTPTPTGELKLGERVIVSSSRGSKAGTLRFVGTTDFAPGVWAGVELDDPLGKNDGSVEGKRYFECAPRFGLFAPIAKVSRSPSNRKPGACAIHSNGRATPLRRSNSRESLTSLGTSVASSRIAVRLGGPGAQRAAGPRATSTPVSAKSALQELLREKQQHLERLMKERELERAEVARATLQVDRAETALAYLKKEAAQTTSENEKLRAELDRLSKLLEDEKQKVEDLMFRSEEENINREDYNKYKEQIEKEKAEMEQRLRNLEAECALQAARADTAAGALRTLEDHRAAELATLADNHKEEIAAAHSLSSELQKLLDEAYALLKEKENEKDSLNKSMSDELTKLKLESERSINDAKTKMAIAQTEFETQLSVLTAKLQLAESKLEAEKQNVERSNKESSQTLLELNTKLTQLQAIIDDKTHELNKVLSTSKEHELNLNKEITKLKMELSAKILDLEQLNDSNQKHVRDCAAIGNEMAALKEQFNNKVNEYENLLNEASQQNDRNINEIVELKQNLTAKTKLYDKLLNDYSASRDTTERVVDEYKQTIHERDKEIIKLKNEYEEANANFNIKHSMIAEEHKKEIEDRNLKIEELLKEIYNHKQTLDKNKIEFDTLNSQLSTNIDEIKILSEQNQKLQKSVDELTQINSELKMKISSLELENGELQRQLQSSIETCKELQSAKEKVETEYLNLTGQTTDSNEQFNKLSQHLKDTEKEFQDLKDKYRETTNNHGRLEQELKQQIFRIQEEFSLEREKLLKTIESNAERAKLLEGKISEYEIQITSMKTKLHEQEADSDVILDKNTILQKEIEILKSKEIEIMNEYQATRQKMEQDIDRYKQEITLLKDEGESSEVKLKEKVDQLIEAQNELNNKLEEARKHEDTLQKIVDDMSQQLANQKIQYENESVQLQTQINTVTEENANLKGEESRLKNSLQEKENYIKELDLKLNMLEVDLKSNSDIIAEKERQIMAMNEEFNMLIENKKQLEEKVNLTLSENNQLKQTYDALVTNSNAECSILNEQQEKLDNLQKQLNDTIQNKADLESKLADTAVELQKINSEYEATSKLLQDNIDAKSKLEASLLEKEKAIQSQSDKNEIEFKKLKTLEDELLLLKQDLDAKNNSIQEKDIQLANLNTLLQSNANETQQKISETQSEFLKLSEKYKTEVESLNNTINNLQTRAAEHDKLVDEVTQQKQKVGELQVLLTKAEDDIKQLTNINNGQRGNYEDLNKQLQSQFDEYKKDSKKRKHELKNKLLEFENELKESKNKINDEIMKQTQLQNKLDEAESKVIDLTNKLELLNVQQSSSLEKDDKLEKLTLELQSIRKSNMETLANSEMTIKNLKLDLEKKIKELDHKNNTISKLQDDLKSQIAKTEIIEREKVLLQKAAAANEAVMKDSNDNGLTTGQNDNKQKTLEDREMLDGQVSFLNSVIVDMQRKNEQLLARLLALEGGNSSPNDEGDAVFNGRSRAVAPRLFCDICEVFDAHDTEDCPRQAAPDPPPAQGPRRTPPAPRPYCDICEVFGHSTEACDEEETF